MIICIHNFPLKAKKLGPEQKAHLRIAFLTRLAMIMEKNVKADGVYDWRLKAVIWEKLPM